jgi:hypothetical protein
VLLRIIRDQWLGSYVRHHSLEYDGAPSEPFFAVASAIGMRLPEELHG